MQRIGRVFVVVALLGALGYASDLWAAHDRVMVTIMATADLHGSAIPMDYARNRPTTDTGLVKLATLVRARRALDPEALLVDAGDTFQGTPFVHLANIESVGRHPFVALMNQMGYDAMAVGNHDFDYGLPLLERIQEQAQFSLLGANAIDIETGLPRFLPYIVRVVRGVRVGILGLTSPGIPGWLPPEKWEGLRFEGTLDITRHYVRHLREQERCDVVVVVFHGGPSEVHGDAVPGVNNGYELVRSVPGIDVLFTGHIHRVVNERVGDTLVLQAGSHARGLALARLHLAPDSRGAFRILRSHGTIQMLTARIPADPDAFAVVAHHERQTQEYLDTPLGFVEQPLTLEHGAWKDTALMDLIHSAQLEYTGAEVSICSLFDPYSRLEDVVSIRDIFKLYPFENYLYTVRMSGRALREHLENSARAYRYESRTEGGFISLDPAIPLFNIDTIQGLRYVIDPRRPIGSRILQLRDDHGSVTDDREYTVAVNSYRAGGTGGYDMVRDAPLIARSEESVRDILIEYIKGLERIPTEADHNWRIRVNDESLEFQPLVR